MLNETWFSHPKTSFVLSHSEPLDANIHLHDAMYARVACFPRDADISKILLHDVHF